MDPAAATAADPVYKPDAKAQAAAEAEAAAAAADAAVAVACTADPARARARSRPPSSSCSSLSTRPESNLDFPLEDLISGLGLPASTRRESLPPYAWRYLLAKTVPASPTRGTRHEESPLARAAMQPPPKPASPPPPPPTDMLVEDTAAITIRQRRNSGILAGDEGISL